jgi:hypothetical protein
MLFKSSIGRLALGAATLALPLTALGAAPASASQYGGYDDDNEPSISIKDVKVHGYDVEVKVKYRCYTDQDDHDNDYSKYGKDDDGKDDEEVEDGEIKVTLTQKHVKYSGEEDVECDGDWAYTWIELDRDYGHLKKGKAWVKATITDPQDEKDSDREEVRIKKHHHNYDD